MADENKSGSRFIVDLGDFKLSDIEEKQVGAEIQALVLRELARTTLSIQIPWHEIDIFNKCDPFIFGMCIERKLKDPFGIPRGGSVQLTPQDHTLIVKTVMEHPFQVFRKLSNKERVKELVQTLPNNDKLDALLQIGKEALQAALHVEQIDDYTKSRIRMMLDAWSIAEKALAALPEHQKQIMNSLKRQLIGKSIEEKIRLFRETGARSELTSDSFREGMELAARILEDGKNSIYSPDSAFNKIFIDGGTVVYGLGLGDVADADGVAGAIGGTGGLLVGGPAGAATAGVISAGGVSIGFGLVAIADAIWDIF